MTIKNFLAKYNFNWLESNFYHFHCVPPLISDKVKDLKKINHKMELNHSNDWRAQFMCPMYLVFVKKLIQFMTDKLVTKLFFKNVRMSGKHIFDLMSTLWPICRSITGDGVGRL